MIFPTPKQKPGLDIYADTADPNLILSLSALEHISGFTTNPTLAKKFGAVDYFSWMLDCYSVAGGKSISFQVPSRDDDDIYRQARQINMIGNSVFAKIPVTDSMGRPRYELIRRMAQDGLRINITACTTPKQLEQLAECLKPAGRNAIISFFFGRTGDCGIPPLAAVHPNDGHFIYPRLLWAGARSLYDVHMAEHDVAASIITLPPELLEKLDRFGGEPAAAGLDVIRQFENDAAGFSL